MYDQLIYEKEPKLHEWNLLTRQKTATCDPLVDRTRRKVKRRRRPEITWTVKDISKAGCLLSNPPKETTFDDEQEMRRAYTLIYDVFRYKYILTQALEDVRFFHAFPNLTKKTAHVWLLLFDLYHRQFEGRTDADDATASKLFPQIGLSLVENALWTKRVPLAAAIARLRIKHNALDLAEMLPEHLKNEKVTDQSKTNPVTCWVNSCKVTDAQRLCKDIETTFALKMVAEARKLREGSFVWDKHCPQIIAFHASMRDRLAKSEFVKKHMLIVQDKSFCLGPATFHKLIGDLELTGTVIQSHVNSPRTTAYLAALLSQNERIKSLLAFSAGNRKIEYEHYLNDLGMENVIIFSDRLIDTPPDASYMEEVVAVFATPPNSYSAVVDPIDLVCSRGGDLSMLEVLAESVETNEAKQRVCNILEEQKKTLRFAMSRPQIQFVLYETHSELEVENNKMVEKAMSEINKVAKLHHAVKQGKINNDLQPEMKEINNNENMDKVQEPILVIKTVQSSESLLSDESTDVLSEVQVPDTDIFDTPRLPKLCSSEHCRNYEGEGCFLALIQRKQVTRMDDKYMIQMAESRGLFGSDTSASMPKTKSGRTLVKKKGSIDESKEKPKKKLLESENIPASISTGSLGSIEMVGHEEKCETAIQSTAPKFTSIGVLARERNTKTILGMLNSSHIRQFVSPFYKQTNQTVASSTPMTTALTPRGTKYTKARKFETETLRDRDKSATPKSQTTLTKVQVSFESSVMGSRRSSQGSENQERRVSKRKLQQIFDRLSTPTQNSIMRTIKQPDQPVLKKPRPTAFELSQRVFLCEYCKKRNP